MRAVDMRREATSMQRRRRVIPHTATLRSSGTTVLLPMDLLPMSLLLTALLLTALLTALPVRRIISHAGSPSRPDFAHLG